VSVPSASTVQATFAATLVDEWIRHGVREVVLCPGSRSTPMALAVSSRPELRTHVRIDERSAGFFALGCSLRSKVPTVVIVTSGTAATELHASVTEADQSGVPMIVVTADRPAELHGVGAPQTTRQRELFGPSVRRYEEPGVARDEASSSWRPMASRLFRSACEDHPGPVHLNAAFVEPLTASPGPLPIGRGDGDAWVRTGETATTLAFSSSASRILVVAGHGAWLGLLDAAHQHHWVVVSDPTCPVGTSYFDAILRDDDVARALRPDLVVRTGRLPASKILQQRLREWSTPVQYWSTSDTIVDPDGLVSEVVRVTSRSASIAVASDQVDLAYEELWQAASTAVEEVAMQLDDDAQQLSEPSTARLVVAISKELAVPLVVGSSMPIRDVEWWTSRGAETVSNRGVNGIDGVNSTICGVAAGAAAVGLVGDVTFLHDVSALTDGVGDAGGSCALVVVDNGGGGIFSFLPQGDAVDPGTFERLFATPRDHDLVAVATGFGHYAERVETVGALRTAVQSALGRTGLSVLVARVPHYRDNVSLHDELNEIAVRAVRETNQ
jgi:2-succinyl-5-enolpyruvyl-6-hydroxy-3-cyclohexene-1-carboxylate synthase